MPRISAASLEEHFDRVWSALVAALDNSLANKAYDDISLSEIAAAAGIARNTIYNYARDKKALVTAATAYSARELIDELLAIAGNGDTPPARLRALMRAVLTWVAGGKYRAIIGHAILNFTEGPAAEGNLFARLFAIVQGVVDEGSAAGDFRKDTRLTVELLGGVAQAATHHIYHAPNDLDVVEAETFRLVINGLANR